MIKNKKVLPCYSQLSFAPKAARRVVAGNFSESTGDVEAADKSTPGVLKTSTFCVQSNSQTIGEGFFGNVNANGFL